MALALPQIDRITSNSTKQVKNRDLKAQFGNGYSQNTKDGINSDIDVWKIEIAPAEGADLVELDNFFASVSTTEWFTWTPLGEVTEKKWRVNKDSLNRKMINTTKFKFNFTMTQAFDLG